MANGNTHRLCAAVAVGTACLCVESRQQKRTAKPLAGAALAALMTNLPDILEPASNPNHRQFFHSLAFAGLVGAAAYKAYNWAPTDRLDELLRFFLLVSTAAYGVHLLLDATTPKSLPFLGRL